MKAVKKDTGYMMEIGKFAERLRQVVSEFGESRFDAVLKITEETLQDPALPQSQRCHFLYFRATTLDCMGRHEDALEILMSLRDGGHGNEILRSIRIVLANIERSARDLWLKDPESPTLERFYEIFNTMHFSPWWLTVAVAKMKVKSGDPVRARAMMEPLLALSPNDPDFLRSGLEIARSIEDCGWLARLEAQVRSLLESHSYDTEIHRLIPLLSEEVGVMSASEPC